MTPLLTDLRLVVGLVVAATVALLVPGVPWQVEWVFGLPLLVVFPGYAAVAVLWPQRPGGSTNRGGSPGWAVRSGLSVVGSALLVAVVGVALAREGWPPLALTPVVLTLGGVTVLAATIAVYRRGSVPRERRAAPLAATGSGSVARAFGTSGPQTVVLVLSVVVLVSALAFAGPSAPENPYSAVYLTDGAAADIGAANGTQELVTGSDNTLSLAVENHEGEVTDYRVVVRLERVVDGTVVEAERLDDFRVTVEPEEVDVSNRTLTPTMTGEGLRLQTLVFEDGATGNVDAESADVTLRLWVNSTDEGSA